MQLPVLWPVSVSTRTLTSLGIRFLDTFKNPANLLKKNLNNTRNNEVSNSKKNLKNGGIVELLIPTLNKIVMNQDTYFVIIMNNRLKIMLPSKAWEDFFQKKKSFSWGNKNLFGQNNYGEVVLNWSTNDQIMPRFGRSFINDKCIFL